MERYFRVMLELQVVELIARLTLAAVFLMAGLAKFVRPDMLSRDLASYRLVPSPLLKSVGFALPGFEIALGILLLLGFFASVASLLAAGLFAVFLGVTTSAIVRRLNVQCGCFGLLYRSRLGWPTLLRDSILFGLAVYVWQFQPARWGEVDVVDPLRLESLIALTASLFAVLIIFAAFARARRARAGEANRAAG